MRAIEKAIWYIENNYRDAISLEDVSKVAGVSKYHLSRIFCYSLGRSVSHYIRARRLTLAAISLAAGEPDILDLALSIGYGSHEAFTRAFKQHFSATPEQVREQAHTDNLDLTEAMTMQREKNVGATLTTPRLEARENIELTGISRFYPFQRVGEIPDQWQTFAGIIPQLTQQQKPTTYGVIYNGNEDSFDYMSAIEAPPGGHTTKGAIRMTIAAQTYLVFEHAGHVATLRDTCDQIWSDWLPASGKTVVEAPWSEQYGDAFDPLTGSGGLEIWIPYSE